MGWAKGSDTEDGRSKKELSEQVAEIAVEREMQKETEEDAKQEEDKKLIEAAMARSSPSQPQKDSTALPRHETPVRRIVLRQPGRGTIVCLKAFEDLDLLCVLRDTGSVRYCSNIIHHD
jgi:hypothetical protein